MIYIEQVESDNLDGKNHHKLLHEFAHELLKKAVLEQYPQKADKLTMRKQEHGKPYFVEEGQENQEVSSQIYFNLSHSGKMAACVIGQAQVGIDIEKIRPYNPKVADRILSDQEWEILQKSQEKGKDFIRFWTLKEAYGKYTGKGLSMDFKKIMFHWEEDGEIISNDSQVKFFQWEINQEYYLALCVDSKAEDIITLTDFKINDKIDIC